MFRTKLVHVCKGTVRYPVGWVQDCDLVCFAYMNNMQYEYIMFIYAIDVLVWVAYKCKLYVAIIMIHGRLMFHVALIYTCNMKKKFIGIMHFICTGTSR